MASALHRAIDWTFRDRRTGAIVIGQWPNPPLWLFLACVSLRWFLEPRGLVDLWLRIGSGAALAWWASDEILRGANPWRRALGTIALTWLVYSAVR